ncbi:MAG: hypothetical protein IIV45_03130 [Lachnospiraceae bacterium]|nr:hypothetical protein [Lachnospiraceae bacterium]
MNLDFIKVFNDKMQEKSVDFLAKGIYTNDNKILSMGSDSKLIGRIFELFVVGVLKEIAQERSLKLVGSNQTTYPDFTMMVDESDTEKYAIDVKTCYVDEKKEIFFALGSYKSFLRDGTKNIRFPYDQYSKHFVIGFAYERMVDEDDLGGDYYEPKEIDSLLTPYGNIKFFVQEKYKIAGDSTNGGDVENIGSYKTNRMDYLIKGEGPFSVLGETCFVEYWRNYPLYREKKPYKNLEGYFKWAKKNSIVVDQTSYERYLDWKDAHDELLSEIDITKEIFRLEGKRGADKGILITKVDGKEEIITASKMKEKVSQFCKRKRIKIRKKKL